jgi:basic amino acid/polyamine antiporter, APA family
MKSAVSLRQSLTLSHATAMVVGTIIGASIFVQPSEITRQMPSVAGIIAVWIAAGILTLFGSLVCAELASAYPQTGGVYVFLREAFSPALGFLWGWAMFWSMHTGIIAAIATVFARYADVFFHLGPTGLRLVAVGVILILSAINYLGVKRGGLVQNVFTAAKVIAIAGMIVLGLAWGVPVSSTAQTTDVTLRGFGLAIAAGLFAYGGWHMVTYTAGETRDAARVIPRALLLGTLIVTACYAGLNAIYLRVLPLDAVRSSTHVAADAAMAVVGAAGPPIMGVLVMISTFGAANGIILVGPRVYYSMAQDGLLFKWLGGVHPVFGTPHRAILLQAVWASVLAWTNTYGALFSRVIYTEWIFFALMAAGLMLLRRRADYRPTMKMWAYPAVPLIFIAASVLIVINQVLSMPGDSLLGLGIVAAGWPVYLIWSRRPRPS